MSQLLQQSHSFEHNEEDVDSCYSCNTDSEIEPTYLEDIPSDLSNLSIDNQQPESVVDDKVLKIVERIVQDGKVEQLKVEQCKVYLRKYGLRLTGNKESLIHRIKEHREILNGVAEKKYPISSFVLNCKGDACTGDVVMFEQKVYETYNIVSRSATGPPCGTRIVVGRIVKESYGAAKQQHTFTVEVLWSKGEKPLPPLHPLLIKGRNLYRLKTLRQRWEDEGERTKVLMEKHSRGSLARSDRESRIREKEKRKMLRENRDLKKKQNRSRPLLNEALKENLGKHANDSTYQPSQPGFCIGKVATGGRAQPPFLQPLICVDNVSTGGRAQPPSLQPLICIDNVATEGGAQLLSLQPVICLDDVSTGGRAQRPYLQPVICIDNVATGGRAQPPSLQPVICLDDVSTGGRAQPPSLQPVICIDKVATGGRAQPPSLQPRICIDNVATRGRAQPPSLQPGICTDNVSTEGRAQRPYLQPLICIDNVATRGRAHPPILQPQHSGILAPNIGVRQPHHQAVLPQWARLLGRNPYHHSQTLKSGNIYHQMIQPQRQSSQQQQLCRNYPQGRCYYGNKCKFLHQQ